MSRLLRFDYLDEKHIINLDQVVSVVRFKDAEYDRTFVQMTNGEFDFYGDEGLEIWHTLCGLVDRSVQVGKVAGDEEGAYDLAAVDDRSMLGRLG